MSALPMLALRRSLLTLLLASSTLGLAGCKTLERADAAPKSQAVPASTFAQASPEQLRQLTTAYAAHYQANEADPGAALNFAQALRASGQHTQALAVLQAATLRNPDNDQLLATYGKVLSDVGRHSEALDVLGRAHRPDLPDWQILSAQGAVLDQMGQHAEARRYYDSALKISPNEPTVLTNYGLSFMLSQDLKRAEEMLSMAASQPQADARVRQNYALVIALQGRLQEANAIVSKDLPPEQAQQNVEGLRRMVSQQNTWKALAQKPASKPATKPVLSAD